MGPRVEVSKVSNQGSHIFRFIARPRRFVGEPVKVDRVLQKADGGHQPLAGVSLLDQRHVQAAQHLARHLHLFSQQMTIITKHNILF